MHVDMNGYLKLANEAAIVVVPNAHKRRSNKDICRSQFVIFTYGRSDGIVRCCKEVQAMPITKKKRIPNGTAVSLGVISAIRQSVFMMEVGNDEHTG